MFLSVRFADEMADKFCFLLLFSLRICADALPFFETRPASNDFVFSDRLFVVLSLLFMRLLSRCTFALVLGAVELLVSHKPRLAAERSLSISEG